MSAYLPLLAVSLCAVLSFVAFSRNHGSFIQVGPAYSPVPATLPSAAYPNTCSSLNGTFLSQAVAFDTDKVSVHHYDLLYEDLLAQFRCRPLKMLEIGLGCDMKYGPGHSLPVWYHYLPHAEIHYLEYDAVCADLHAASIRERYGDRVHIHSGDQANHTDLDRLIQRSGGAFDLIIDDGGHTWHQQHTSLDALMPRALRAGGLYVVEDLITSAPTFTQYASPGDENFVERVLRLQRYMLWEHDRSTMEAALTQHDKVLLDMTRWIVCAPGMCALKKLEDEQIRMGRRFGPAHT